ncbi:2-oxo-4-hydroxy-4-carboxy-5-ureidoimidazoline decarboxylase [Amycolatopsis suaedae]|uniref:2-oxo-4-hydroxy-4-carboxy-5-ureidoimidazoline decarboxylase n=1 Tax=Amycolatopsis suaedae TaxID=2510978 RepID=A0A4Q7JA97_9PSEU|nr:2-oxo-4-hydroxy-4-carboxy-5-ureidoimidazoline decarboxylase [Amycolatopsis suaedae]RZQ63948.1 2-oxo-4-hydroxy-4-carboxy-5-ureidoimidazoline decarboxylase [Amycolatopsis suaedae]
MLDEFNALPAADAEAELLACCATPAWARRVAAARPFPDADALVEEGERAFDALGWDEVATAVAAHPRIGERAAGADRESAWSRAEQAAVTAADVLAEANAEYERRFGMVFLIRATGRDGEEILAALRERLGNDEATEREVVRGQLREIVALRLRKLVTA